MAEGTAGGFERVMNFVKGDGNVVWESGYVASNHYLHAFQLAPQHAI